MRAKRLEWKEDSYGDFEASGFWGIFQVVHAESGEGFTASLNDYNNYEGYEEEDFPTAGEGKAYCQTLLEKQVQAALGFVDWAGEKTSEEKAKPVYKYGLEISEPQKRLWVGKTDKGVVLDTLYTNTWGGNRMAGTREKVIENAKLIVKALNAFNSSVDAPYCHDLEQRIELLEMQLEEAQAKAEAYDRLMSGEPTAKEIANVLNRIIAMDHDGKWHAFCSTPYAKSNYQWIPVRGSSKYRVPCFHIKFDGDWEDSLTLPDGWEEA